MNRNWALAPLNPDYLKYVADARNGRHVGEVIPLRRDARQLAAARGNVALLVPPQPPKVDGICSFPAAFDRRKLGQVTPAWTTGTCGACWTSASIASLESCFAPKELRDFSEAHMQLKYGRPDAKCGEGGNCEIAAFYFAAWRGPVDENAFDPNAASPPPAAVRKHVQNVLFLPHRTGPLDNCWIKLAVMHLGGVYSGISRGYGFHPPHPTYYNPTDGVIHAVSIVGWDDDFDRMKFFCNDPSLTDAQKIPPANGAFIVKDNGGPEWGEQGFLYVSYYDASIGSTPAVYVGEPVGNFTRNYQYDTFGVTRTLVPPGIHKDFSYQGNVFTAVADESLAAVGFYEMEDPEMDYEIQIHLDPDNGPARSSGPHATVGVQLLVQGYYTVRLPKKIPLKKGQRFGVVLKGKQRGGNFPSSIPIEEPKTAVGMPVTAAAGQSFVSVDGSSWTDLTQLQVPVSATEKVTLTGANLCIKAFTNSPVHVDATLIEADAHVIKWTMTNDGPSAVRLRPVARRYRRERETLAPMGDDVFAAYAEGDSGVRQRLEDGWIEVGAGKRMTAFSPAGALAHADRVRYNAYLFDKASNMMLIPDFWKYIVALLHHPPVVTSTNPASNAHVNYLGLSVILVTFDRAIKLGPASGAITVTSSMGSKTYMPMVSGSQLKIVLSTPLSSNQLGGTVWTVHLPATAILETVYGDPMKQDYSWSFTVTGVN